MKENIDWEHGRVLKSVSLADYQFTETAYPPEFKISAHSHSFVYFCFVLQGNFAELYGKTERIYNASTLIFHPLEETHADYFFTKSRCLNIQLRSDKFQQLSINQKVTQNTKVFKKGKIIYLVSRLYEELCSIDEFSNLTIEGLMLELFAEIFRQSKGNKFSKKPPRWLLHVKELIDEEFPYNLTVASLARSENVHPTHLSREFKRHCKMTIGDYVRRKRIDLACHELVNSNAPINEIALDSGFFDQSHFTRVFKKATGLTPTIYRSIFTSR